MLLGAHIGISRGFPQVPAFAASLGCDVVQVFSKNQMQWKVPTLKVEDAVGFREASKRHLKGPALVHTSYLLNLASMDDALWAKSVDGLTVEVERAEALGIPWVVFHPGSPKEKSAEWGCARVAEGVRTVLERTKGMSAGARVRLEEDAGRAVGRTFEELAAMLDGIGDRRRTGVCFDTCHVFVSGYDLRDDKGYEAAFASFDAAVGLDRLKCFHLNDSQGDLGSNKDRHASPGEGRLGEAFWRRLLADPRFRTTPGYLETPQGEDGYAEEIRRLRAWTGP